MIGKRRNKLKSREEMKEGKERSKKEKKEL